MTSDDDAVKYDDEKRWHAQGSRGGHDALLRHAIRAGLTPKVRLLRCVSQHKNLC